MSLLQNIHANLTDTWATSVAYKQYAMVIKDGYPLICLVAHTSGTYATDVSSGYWVSANENVPVPTVTGTQSLPIWLLNLTKLHIKNSGSSVFAATYAHGITAVATAYQGGVYSPTQNRIYLVPYNQSNQTNWHYISFIGSTVGLTQGMFGSTVISSTL